jgi:transcriptional regulator with XRE-family HTH domain
MNESLRRAMIRARLTEEDVAARLAVDPKTVQRWLEGRLPYPRHRWILADALGLDEVDLWPQLRTSQSRPRDIQTVYPHREDIPRETWVNFFSQAQERTDILANSALFLAADPDLLALLAARAAAGVRERICLRDPDACYPGTQQPSDAEIREIREAISRYSGLRQHGKVDVRLHKLSINNSLFRSDDECLVALSAYGILASRTPVIHLRRTRAEDLFGTYLESFESTWSNASTRLE